MSKLPADPGANGASIEPPPAAMPDKPAARPRDARQDRYAQTFANIVAVLMRDPNFRNLRLADLEWLVLPPVMAGQFKLGHAATQQEQGILVPMAVAVWARVSAVVDKGLSENLDKHVHLRPDQWASGDILWLMAVAGDPRVVPLFLKQLAETEFKDKEVKWRSREADGKVLIKTLSESV